MAALNTIAREHADTIRDGIAWLIVWKTGRSWHAESVYLSSEDDTFEPEDLDRVREIVDEDPSAVMVNGYYCGHLGEDMTAAEIEAGLRWHYENGCNLLKDSAAFPPEPMERPANIPAGIPWHGKAAAAEDELDPYVCDGNMSAEDYELMHEHVAADKQKEKPTDYATPEQVAILVALLWLRKLEILHSKQQKRLEGLKAEPPKSSGIMRCQERGKSHRHRTTPCKGPPRRRRSHEGTP